MVRAYYHICAAKRCYNSRLTHPEKEFFSFPSDLTLCKKWLENSERTDLDVLKVTRALGHYKLCSDHFEDKWFTNNSKKWLDSKSNPVPTIFSNLENQLSDIQTVDFVEGIDLPPGADDPTNTFECVLNPYELLVEVDRQPVSYHSPQLVSKKVEEAEVLTMTLLNLNSNTELHKLEDMCRFCMDTTFDNYVEIFRNSLEAVEIRQIVEEVMHRKMNICDGLPLRICRMCIYDLKTCYKLMEKFKKANNFLRLIAKYSLYLENEEDCDTNYDDCTSGLTEADFFKPLPKNAMVIPLKHFKLDPMNSQNSTEESNCQPVPMEDNLTGDDVMNFSEPARSLLTPKYQESASPEDGKVELFCSNVVLLPSCESSSCHFH